MASPAHGRRDDGGAGDVGAGGTQGTSGLGQRGAGRDDIISEHNRLSADALSHRRGHEECSVHIAPTRSRGQPRRVAHVTGMCKCSNHRATPSGAYQPEDGVVAATTKRGAGRRHRHDDRPRMRTRAAGRDVEGMCECRCEDVRQGESVALLVGEQQRSRAAGVVRDGVGRWKAHRTRRRSTQPRRRAQDRLAVRAHDSVVASTSRAGRRKQDVEQSAHQRTLTAGDGDDHADDANVRRRTLSVAVDQTL